VVPHGKRRSAEDLRRLGENAAAPSVIGGERRSVI
jgi:hypothetical protein